MAGDEGLYQRVVVTTLVVTVIVFGGLVAYFPWTVGVNFAVGAVIGLVSLGVLVWLVREVTGGRGESRPRSLAAAGAVQVAKYGLIALVLYPLFRAGWANAPALAAGFTLPVAVVCLKAAGRRLNERLGLRTADFGPRTSDPRPGDEGAPSSR